MEEEQDTVPEPNTDDQIHEAAATHVAAATHERAQATEIKRPGAGRRISYTLFNRETRAGRFLRGMLRWLLTILILLALGGLAVYLLGYRPLEQSLNQLRVQATESVVDLQRAQKDLQDARASMESAQSNEQEAQERLGIEQSRVQLLRSVVSLRAAQSAIAVEDQTAAEEHVTQAEQTLQQSQARLDRIDPNASSTLQALFTLVRNGLDRDLEVAGRDLDRLIAELEHLETLLDQPANP